jgi:hypothetical protein
MWGRVRRLPWIPPGYVVEHEETTLNPAELWVEALGGHLGSLSQGYGPPWTSQGYGGIVLASPGISSYCMRGDVTEPPGAILKPHKAFEDFISP